MKKTLLSTEDKTKSEFIPNDKCSMVEKTPLSKLQQRIRHKTINKLMSSGIKADCLREMLNLKVKGRKVKKTLPLPSSETKNRFCRFLAMREFRRMEKPLISKLQLRIMREKINQKLGER
ncbi:hypothetical protein AVEN_14111-1 [Araneus ventricosus]|uniref:Uncharacterized protein n=1 Tax=Araneus ventricosus TaxID=182803 RepID=A0A4Y2TJ77_ARAVE|nr:hypothetical protein AVEN_14111-1 [Araneus ventricosus]